VIPQWLPGKVELPAVSPLYYKYCLLIVSDDSKCRVRCVLILQLLSKRVVDDGFDLGRRDPDRLESSKCSEDASWRLRKPLERIPQQ
jgi:hypothetical protein